MNTDHEIYIAELALRLKNVNKDPEIRISELALWLKELDKSITKSIMEKSSEDITQLVFEFTLIRKLLKTYIMDKPVLKIHNRGAQSIIKKISEDHTFAADKYINDLENIAGEEIHLNELDVDELDDIANDIFLNWYSQYDYVMNLYKIRSLILGISVPNNLKKFIEEARRCYAFQQYNAVYSLCRTILEISIKDICERKGIIKKRKDNVSDIDDYKIGSLIDKISTGELKNRVKNIYYHQTSILIHGGKIVTPKETEDMFLRTLQTIEQLYEHQGY
jgi:hypothetical protein